MASSGCLKATMHRVVSLPAAPRRSANDRQSVRDLAVATDEDEDRLLGIVFLTE